MKKNTEPLKRQYAILKGQGMQQRDIAKKLGVSVQTICKWKKSLPISHYLLIRDSMVKRLAAISKDKNTPAMDIYNLSNALVGIERTIDKYTYMKGITG
ncbi:helix-turn-helix domain-containing protein [Paraflavitalea speifideaquila]|uniref:helix-turn-helix domain-containing protein n=1 Tax=Paraflavitalea speifideaquila TaxID=3076558 RepID=UPI0028EE25C4|nr:helix-turn-helix domain-containing protein [Paraflavitalea speifideiaquila]